MRPALRNAGIAGGVWAVTVLLAPVHSLGGPGLDVVLALPWLGLLTASTVESRPVRTGLAALVGLSLVAVWVLASPAYPALAVLYLSALAWGSVLGPAERLRGRVLAAAAVPLLAPVALVLVLSAVGNADTNAVLRREWAPPAPSFALFSVALRLEALIVLAWLALGRRSNRVLVPAAFAVVLLTLVGRAASLASLTTLPSDGGWSDPPLLLNLLKLRVGAPFYGPFEDCNSYQYNPTFEVVQRTLLAPLGLDLSLVANRMLGLVWQLCTAATLTVVLLPFAKTRVRRAFLAGAMLLVAFSSFIAWNLHPDHLLMPWFALALGVALHWKRLPERWVLAALALLPAIAVAVKMTGAGIGVGLVLLLGWPLPKKRALALGGGAVLAFAVLGLYERIFPRFLQYTVALQASHAIAWDGLLRMWTETPTLLLVVAVGAVVAARGPALAEARREGVRALLVTLGFALPSLVAYLKVGGRVNSLLPFTIGGAVVLARIGLEVAFVEAAAVMAAWGVLTVTPTTSWVAPDLRAEAVQRHARTVAILQQEERAHRTPLLYGGTAAWIAAGRRDVPRDRWQSISELVMGHHHEADVAFERIASGAYDTVVTSDDAIDPSNATGVRLGEVLQQHFVLETDDTPAAAPHTLPPVRVFRYRRR